MEVLQHPEQQADLQKYVTSVIGRFANDRRVQGWDVWNEPENGDGGAPGRPGLEPKNKADLVLALLPKVFAWAREAQPSQPLTSAPWLGNWSSDEKLSPMQRVQFDNSDVISFHNYGKIDDLRRAVESLRRFGRPLLCTEFMARPNGSTFEPHLAYLKEQKVAAYCWGFVSGKTQTIYPWDSWQKKYTAEPPVWFHDILRADGSPFGRGSCLHPRGDWREGSSSKGCAGHVSESGPARRLSRSVGGPRRRGLFCDRDFLRVGAAISAAALQGFGELEGHWLDLQRAAGVGRSELLGA